MKLAEFCATLEERLSTAENPESAHQLAALALQQAFKVKDDEVSLMRLDSGTETLRFVWPIRLGGIGSLPVSTRDSLAARTVREKRAQLNNRFANTMHASIFEQIQLDKGKAAEKVRPEPIHKIMSVPLLGGEAITGVAQVCRKGKEPGDAGADFAQTELDAFTEIAKVIGRFI